MEDKELVERILRRGDTKCFSELVGRYSGMIFSKVFGVVKRRELAREITQQAFVRAYERLGDWRGTTMGAWLNAIAMHLALNALDKERRQRAEPIETARGAASENEYSDGRERLLQAMETAVRALPEQDQSIVRQHYYEGRKTDEIAQSLGMTTSNVLVRLHRIRERLRKELQDERDE
ncbi:RNA polymerase sigma factor [Prevotella dentasini]|uniref:RNA polymerase sigma factor n=1 Tax=Prevotella dentasini TaxID=589537 RepID=UPI00046AD870|nr:sigma-70 family RNA polymerase sigma factor [Prevotella dentasini]